MDHLRLPPSSRDLLVDVPLICECEYNGKDFATYLEQRGYDKEKILESDFGNEEISKFHIYLQEWLFFGLLIEIFKVSGILLKPSAFHWSSTSPAKFVTTKDLPRNIEDWKERAQKSRPDVRAQWLDRIDSILGEACLFVR